MKNLSVYIDPVKKDYTLDDKGNLVSDKTLKTPSYLRLKTKRTQWLYAPDNKFGSDFYLIRKNLTTSDAFRLSNTAEKCLEILIDQGRASDVTASVLERTRHGAAIEIKITDIKGESEDTFLVPVGGIV